MDNIWKLPAAALLALALSTAPVSVSQAASPAPVKAEHGMVVTAHHLASEIGVEVMKKGGNAVERPSPWVTPWRSPIRKPATSAAAAS